MNTNDANNAAVYMAAIQLIQSTIEKGFALAEANAQRRHEESMYSLETARIEAQANARLTNAQAAEVEARVQK